MTLRGRNQTEAHCLNRCMAGKKDLRGFKRKVDKEKRDEIRAR